MAQGAAGQGRHRRVALRRQLRDFLIGQKAAELALGEGRIGGGDAAAVVVIVVQGRGVVGHGGDAPEVPHGKVEVLHHAQVGVEAEVVGPDDAQVIELIPGVAAEGGGRHQHLHGLRGGHDAGPGPLVPDADKGVHLVEVAADRQVGPRLLPDGHQLFQIIQFHPVVGVGEDDIVALRVVDAEVAGGGQAAVGLMEHPDVVPALGLPVAHVLAAVGGAVVHDDDFIIPVGLAQQAVHGLGEIFARVVHGYDYGNQIAFPPIIVSAACPRCGGRRQTPAAGGTPGRTPRCPQ